MIKNKVEEDGEEDGVTREAQQQMCENATLNNDSTNDNICNNSTSAGRNIDNGSEKLPDNDNKNKIETMNKDVGLDGEA